MNFERTKKKNAMKKIQLTAIIATALLYCWMFLGVSCNKCSNSNEETTTVTESQTDTVYGPQTESASGDYDAEYNAGSNASGKGSRSGAGTAGNSNDNTNPENKNDTVKKVPAGGSTAKEARFSSSGSN